MIKPKKKKLRLFAVFFCTPKNAVYFALASHFGSPTTVHNHRRKLPVRNQEQGVSMQCHTFTLSISIVRSQRKTANAQLIIVNQKVYRTMVENDLGRNLIFQPILLVDNDKTD